MTAALNPRHWTEDLARVRQATSSPGKKKKKKKKEKTQKKEAKARETEKGST